MGISTFFGKTDKGVDRLGYWFGFYTLLSGALSWVGNKLAFLSAYGWPEAVLFGLFFSAVLMILVTSSLALWRYFKPLPEVASRTAVKSQTGANNFRALRALFKGEDISTPMGKRLYTGDVNLNARKLESDHVLEIGLFAYNATGFKLDLKRVDGFVTAAIPEDNSVKEEIELPPAAPLRARSPDRDIKPYESFLVVLEQPLRPHMAEKIKAAIDVGSVQFRLADLNVVLSRSDDPVEEARLPLWDGVTLSKKAEWMHSGRLSIIRADPIRLGGATLNRLQSGTE
ncbi:MAG: hypothetical protein WA979_10685 [Pacificimonas sp.]